MATPVASTPTTNAKWALEIDTGTATPTWVKLKGMSQFTPSVENTKQDASDYDSNGWGSDAVTMRKWSLQCEVLRRIFGTAYDVGQEYLRTAADTTKLVHVRWYEKGITAGEAYEGYALVEWSPQGGDVSGLSKVSITLIGQGERTAIATPVTP